MRMGLRIGLAAVLAAAALSAAAGADGASAATEIGSHCQGDTSGGNATQAQVANDPSDPLPAAAPSDGVVTSWSVNVAPLGFALPEKLKLLRPAASPNQFTVVGESRFEAVLSGSETFATRIPVHARDHLGVYASSSSGALLCSATGKEGDIYGSAAGDVTVGSTRSFLTSEGNQVAVAATIEPDADGDGYGDETQDRCPQDASIQTACPAASRLELDLVPLVKRKSVTVLVTTSSQASVAVSATVLRHGKERRVVGVTRYPGIRTAVSTVNPGTIARFKLYFYRGLNSALDSLSTKKSMKLRITAIALSTGTKKAVDVKLKGRKTTHAPK
jgi:hypothetical protein